MALLEIDNLSVSFGPPSEVNPAVDGLSLSIERGEVLGIVGESGSGKSVSMLAVMGLLDAPAVINAGGLRFDGRDLLTISARERRSLLGVDIAMIFQDPMTSLNPSYTVGFQLMETLAEHDIVPRKERRERALALLRQVEIPDPERRLSAYPHQLSGGMSQRVMIAMALAGNPKLLIADEPTTALDVTIQAQILELLVRLQAQTGMALILITHDLAVVADIADRVAVMYAGQLVELQSCSALFETPHHPYTAALLRSTPELATRGERLSSIPGVVPTAADHLAGCLFAPRCERVVAACREHRIVLTQLANAEVRCTRPLGVEPA